MRLVERHFPRHHFQLADALIGATAIEQRLLLATGNSTHFKAIKELNLQTFVVH